MVYNFSILLRKNSLFSFKYFELFGRLDKTPLLPFVILWDNHVLFQLFCFHLNTAFFKWGKVLPPTPSNSINITSHHCPIHLSILLSIFLINILILSLLEWWGFWRKDNCISTTMRPWLGPYSPKSIFLQSIYLLFIKIIFVNNSKKHFF